MLKDLISKNSKGEDYEIITANDGVKILNYIIEDQFKGNLIKCIITDENMEFINGSEAVRILASLCRRNKIRSVPVIFLSSHQDDFILNTISDVLDCELMTKPISIKELQQKLEEIQIFRFNPKVV